MSSASLLYKDPGSTAGAAGGGVDGHGTHLPYLQGAYGAKAVAGVSNGNGNGNGGRGAAATAAGPACCRPNAWGRSGGVCS